MNSSPVLLHEHGTKSSDQPTYHPVLKENYSVMNKDLHPTIETDKSAFFSPVIKEQQQSGTKLVRPKSGGKIFPPLKFLCYSWPRCGSLTFVVINRVTGYQF